ncbi:MAG: hypothetical protein PVF13_06650 [Chromatiales bacterium]|jgi:hypothetical protein
MKGYLQPLSEVFIYSSPERPSTGSFRWVRQRQVGRTRGRIKRQQEVPHAGRHTE